MVDDCVPVIVNFSCLDDQVLVWNGLKSGARRSNVKITRDCRSNREKVQHINTRKVVKRQKKRGFHHNCVPEAHLNSLCGHDFTEENDHKQDEERSLLLHGIPSDWVEEEMMDDDVDFIRDVLEQKVIKCLENVGIKKRVRSLTSTYWSVPQSCLVFSDYYLGHLQMEGRSGTQKCQTCRHRVCQAVSVR